MVGIFTEKAQRAGICINCFMALKEGFYIVIQGGGTPLDGKGPLLQRDGIKILHAAQMVVIGKGYGKYGKFCFNPVVELFFLEKIEGKGAFIRCFYPFFFQKIRYKGIVLLHSRQFLLGVGIIIGGCYAHAENRSFLKIAGGPSNEGRNGKKQADGNHEGQADQGHGFCGGFQLEQQLAE